MTLKKVILRGLLGIPIGVFINITIVLITSLIHGYLSYEATSPLKDYTIQYSVSIVIGFVFAVASTIFEVDTWSILKQTVIHFIIISITFLPCAILAGWMKLDFMDILIYCMNFAIIYVVIWIVQYFIWKNRIVKLNRKLKNQ
jgi:ABC-type multidrug transport system fused ATPase/permease subunit